MSEYFPKPNSLGVNLKVELDLPVIMQQKKI